jgi:hypothetical protein
LNRAHDQSQTDKHPGHHDRAAEVAHLDLLPVTSGFPDRASLEQGHHLGPAPWRNLDATHPIIDAHRRCPAGAADVAPRRAPAAVNSHWRSISGVH